MRSFAETCSKLREILGAQLVAYIAGVGSTSTIRNWIDGTSEPNPIQARRIETALRIASGVFQSHGQKLTQLWFQGTEELLGDRAPARFILETQGGDQRIFAVAQDFSLNH